MTKIEPKVHYTLIAAKPDWGVACGVFLWHHDMKRFTTDKALVTCLSCKRTKAYGVAN